MFFENTLAMFFPATSYSYMMHEHLYNHGRTLEVRKTSIINQTRRPAGCQNGFMPRCHQQHAKTSRTSAHSTTGSNIPQLAIGNCSASRNVTDCHCILEIQHFHYPQLKSHPHNVASTTQATPANQRMCLPWLWASFISFWRWYILVGLKSSKSWHVGKCKMGTDVTQSDKMCLRG